MKRGKLKNITRMDYKRSHGWWVRFEYRAHPISKMFSDSRYGGKRIARMAAIQYRDAVLMTLPARDRQRQAPGKGRIWRETRSYVLASGERRTYEAWTGWCRVAPTTPRRATPALKSGAFVGPKQWYKSGSKGN